MKGKWLLILFFLILPALLHASMINEWWLWEEEEEVRPRPVKIEEAQQLGKVWKDPYLGMEFVWVPGGCYEMGQSDEDKKWLIRRVGKSKYNKYYAHEKPMHEVCVDGFWMGRYEVMVRQFRRFVAETGYKTDAEKGGYCWIWDGGWKKKRGANWRDPKFSQDENHPVVCVSWNDAVAFAEWLSKKSGYFFRLPTEAEWEYACRNGGKKLKYGTSTGDLSHDLANYWEKGGRDKWKYTAPVGSFPPNELGLYDMSGNVWEWCEDVYSSDAYKHHNRNNPIHTGGGSSRVVRGGCWFNLPRGLRCANRNYDLPSRRSLYLGFRLLLQK
ncbi:formylglycine-generating enzyme family protein [Methanosarcinales archaeon]|nr:MAG: formylglycine-generating enzyme family protein [Methanosarcinales archaeon]